MRAEKNKQEFELSLYRLVLHTLIATDHGEVVSTKHEKVVFNNGRTDAADLLPYVNDELGYMPLTLQGVCTLM